MNAVVTEDDTPIGFELIFLYFAILGLFVILNELANKLKNGFFSYTALSYPPSIFYYSFLFYPLSISYLSFPFER